MAATAGSEIVGRDEELAAIASFLGNGDHPRALLLEGEAGIGKTTLWSAGLEDAGARDYRVLVARPTGAETQLAFAALDDLLGSGFDEVEQELPAPQRRALAVALLREDATDSPPEPRAIAAAFLGALRLLASRSSVLVAVDDVQWLDAPSASALAFAVRRLERVPAVLFLTRRLEHDAEAIPLDLERSLQERLDVVRVGPLSFGGLHRMLQDRLGTSFPRPVLRKLHETSGGNPFYALELARALERQGGQIRPGGPLPVAGDLQALLRERLDTLPEEARHLLALAAVLPEPSIELLEQAVGASVEDAAHLAVDAHMITVQGGRIRFVHPLLANAAALGVEPEHLREARRRLAEGVDDPVLRASQLALAAEAPDALIAGTLEDAADVARARGSPATAAELLERASELTPPQDAGAWARRTTAAGSAHASAGDEGRGAALWREVVERAAPGPARARALADLSRQRLDLDGIEQARSEAGDDPALIAWLDYVRLFTLASLGSYRAAIPDGHAAIASAEVAGDSATLVQALGMLAWLETVAGVGEPRAHLEQASQLYSTGMQIAPFYSPAAFLARHCVITGELDLARRCFAEVDEAAEHAGDEESRAQLWVFVADLEYRAGNFVRASELGQELIDFVDQGGEELQGRRILRLPRALASAQLGEIASAREDATAGLAEAESYGTKYWQGRLRAALGAIEIAAGDHKTALRWLEPVASLEEEAGVGDPCVWMYAGDEVEALVSVGRLDDGARKLRRLDERGLELDRPWIAATAARCEALLDVVNGDVAHALEVFTRALACHERLPMPLERGRTLLAQGQAQRRAKRRRDARDSLGEALAIFEELEATPWAQKARSELARIGGRAPTGGLTATERRIAELVADGRANKEVAAELFVTVKTVEANLTRIYAKLGVRSRTELARKLASN